MAYKLKCKEDGTEFYFKGKEDMQSFALELFNNWVNLHFESPEEINEKDIPEDKLASFEEAGYLKAKDALPWAFKLQDSLGMELTQSQRSFMDMYFKGRVSKN